MYIIELLEDTSYMTFDEICMHYKIKKKSKFKIHTGNRINYLEGCVNLIVKESLDSLSLKNNKYFCDYTTEEINSLTEKCLELHNKYGLGVCLSKEEHDRFHSIYGYGNNTQDEYEEYKNMRITEINMKDVV